MWTTHLATTVAFARRAVPALGLAAVLLATALGPPASAPAHGQTERDRRGEGQQQLPAPPAPQARMAQGAVPRARLQVVVKSIRILDDRDVGDGEFRLVATFERCPSAPAPCVYEDSENAPGYLQQAPGTASLAKAEKRFDAGEGTLGLDWVLPQANDPVYNGYDLSEGAGYPVFSGAPYLFRLDLWELDWGGSLEFMGSVILMLREEDGWGVGTYEVRGLFERGGKYFVTDYEAWIEIRRTPLPDLVPTAIRVVEVVGVSGIGKICMSVVNAGWEPAGPSSLTLAVDKADHRIGTVNVGGLGIGETKEGCVIPPLSVDLSGLHGLFAIADEAGAVPELDELNNEFFRVIDRRPTPTPTATPIPALADLTVSAIRVRGREPDGKDDCKDGKNDIAVVVKNGERPALEHSWCGSRSTARAVNRLTGPCPGSTPTRSTRSDSTTCG